MARVHGSSKTAPITPTVKLISMMSNPVGTLFSIWHGSRFNDTVSPEEIQILYNKCKAVMIVGKSAESILNNNDRDLINKLIEWYPELITSNNPADNAKHIISEVASMAVKANLPPADSLMMVFEIDNVTASWRNQLVRSRLGMQQFWTMTSRTMDLTQMDVNRLESIDGAGSDAVKIYDDAVQTIREAIKKLVDLGVPVEDIRLTPDNMTHRVYWTCSVRILKTIIPKRISWIAQASLWSPIVEGIIHELNSQCPEVAGYLGVPDDVVIKDGKVVIHKYDNENLDRWVGKDYQAPDPLWIRYKGYDTLPANTDWDLYVRMKSKYINLWSDEVLKVIGWDKNDPHKLTDFEDKFLSDKLLSY